MSEFRDNLAIGRRLTVFLLPYWKRVAVIALFSLVSLGIGLLNPLIAKMLIDRSFMQHDVRSFLLFTGIGAAVFLVGTAASGFKNYYERVLKLLLHLSISKKLFSKLAAMPLAYFHDKSQGEHLYRVTQDVDTVADFLAMKVTFFFIQIIRAVIIGTILCSLTWQIPLFIVFVSPVVFVTQSLFRRKRAKIGQELYSRHQGVFRRMAEFFLHIKLVKALAQEIRETRSYLVSRVGFTRASIRTTRIEQVGEQATMSLVRLIGGLITLWVGYMVVRGRLSIGTMSAIALYLGQLMEVQTEALRTYEALIITGFSGRGVMAVLDAPLERPQAPAVRIQLPARLDIEAQGVSFGYLRDAALFKEVTFSIPAASHVAFAGRSGCGKTTLLYLLLKLYAPWEGDIRYAGHSLKGIAGPDLADRVAVAFREPYLWNDTVGHNISYAMKHPCAADIERVARQCLVHEFVDAMPGGYGTIIGEDACKISDGQKQKIALARALAMRPSVLILDEAMAAMDSRSEDRIMRTIRSEYPDMTVITVSHRLATVKAAEQAYFFKGNGGLCLDSPDRLLMQEPEFNQLFASQAQGAQVDETPR